MELSPYVDSLRSDLMRAAEAGGSATREHAERLALALEPAVRMALLEALSHAAAEITSALRAEAVEVRLKGREPQFVVSAAQPIDEAPGEHEDPEDADSDVLARVTVRIPESLKARAEESAAEAGQSLNGWIVAAIRRATRDKALHIDLDLGSLPFGGHGPDRPRTARRVQGWAR